MIHSFAITERDVIFWELPVLFDLRAASSFDIPFLWDPSYGARIGVMPLGGAGSQIRWVEIEPCYVFHELNAFRDGRRVVLDVCRHALHVGRRALRRGPARSAPLAHLRPAAPRSRFRDEVRRRRRARVPDARPPLHRAAEPLRLVRRSPGRTR